MARKEIGPDLEKLFTPRTVAVIGASNTPGKVGYALVKNLIEADYSGEIIPINRHEKKIHGIIAYPSIDKADKQIDMALIAVPAQYATEVLKECAQKGVKSAVIITAGFSETGEEGKKLESEMEKIIIENKMSVVGPNTLGIINTENGLNASFSATFPQQGHLAVVSQSGALCTAILDWARQEKVGFSKFISTGNKTFLNEADYFEYLEKDPRTKSVLVYMESVKDAKRFLKSAARLAKKKPVVVIKAGRTLSGQKAATSHTGAMSVDDKIFFAACKKANIMRVGTIENFFDMAKLLAKLKKPRGYRLAVVTNAGGPGVIAADAADACKFILPQFTPKTLAAVKEINPHPSNPLDLIGDAKPIDYRTALKMLQADSNIDIVYTLLTPQSMTNPERVADIVVSLNKGKPIICSFIGGTAVAHPRRYLKEHGVAEFETPERGIESLSMLEEYSKRKSNRKIFDYRAPADKGARKMLRGKKRLSMEEAFTLLAKFQIRTPKTIFFSKKEELDGAKINFPVALKAAGGTAHKTDFGLVKTNIRSRAELEKSAEYMLLKLADLGEKPMLAAQEMANGQEVLVSSITTEFGKAITYGLGGIFVEVMKDYSQKIAPLAESDVEEMLSEVKGTKVLEGARTKKKYDIEALKKLIKSLSRLALACPEISEIELNPVIVGEEGCYAVDAVVTL